MRSLGTRQSSRLIGGAKPWGLRRSLGAYGGLEAWGDSPLMAFRPHPASPVLWGETLYAFFFGRDSIYHSVAIKLSGARFGPELPRAK
jgi:hypothetical protein